MSIRGGERAHDVPPDDGWFNAHCHLELSFLKGKITAGIPFVDWLGELLRIRNETPEEKQRAAAVEAIEGMIAEGTRTLFDIVRKDTCDATLRRAQIEATLFYEAIEWDPAKGAAEVNGTLARQHQHGPLPPALSLGLSPHAVYTTSAPLLRAAAHQARATGQWLCIHAAETAEEDAFCRKGSGPLRDFFDRLLPKDWKTPGVSPIQWLDLHGCLGPRTLLVHCNFIGEADLRIIAQRGCAVVVCPGTHVWFGRDEFPLERLVRANVPTFLGTDSLASNEALSMEREVALARELAPRVSLDYLMSRARGSAARWFNPAVR